jgi:hypothetical protein
MVFFLTVRQTFTTMRPHDDPAQLCLIEDWFDAPRSQKSKMPVKYRLYAHAGLELPWDKINYDFYQKYLSFIAFLIERRCLSPSLYGAVQKNFAVRFLLKGMVDEALNVIWDDLSKQVENPFLEVFNEFMHPQGLYYYATMEDRIRFIYTFARMFKADDSAKMAIEFLRSVEIEEETVPDYYRTIVDEMIERENSWMMASWIDSLDQ